MKPIYPRSNFLLSKCFLGFCLSALATLVWAEPDRKTAIVLNSGEASVSLIDMQARKVYKTFPVGKEPHHLMITHWKWFQLPIDKVGYNFLGIPLEL